MADVRAWYAEEYSGCAVTEVRYFDSESRTLVGTAAEVMVG